MNNRQRTLAILNYDNYDRLPIIHFSFWSDEVIGAGKTRRGFIGRD